MMQQPIAAERQDLKKLVNTHMADYQVHLFYELEAHLSDKQHPLRQLTDGAFRGAFLKHYEQYVDKKTPNTTNIDLLNRIIAKTVGLQTEYVYKMAEKY